MAAPAHGAGSDRSDLTRSNGRRPAMVVIPAAGLGRRFLPVSRVVAKELLLLGRKPLVHHALDEVERAGFTSATIVTSPSKPALRSYFDPEPQLERALRERGDLETLACLREAAAIAGRLRLRFVEQSSPLGLGDAVRLAGARQTGPFAVLLPDDVIPGADHWRRLLDLHAATGRPCFCVRPVPVETAHRFGIAVCSPDGDGRLRVERLVEKPPRGRAPSNLSVLGRYVITADVLGALERMSRGRVHGSELQLTDAFAELIARSLPVLAVPFAGELFDNGTPEEYASSAARYLARVTAGAAPA
ncbi:MAG TPA: sugar phosphate nucleotidyltransferase [Candidatus Dormibacteraeota bacterium]